MKKAITDEHGEIISIIEGTQETIDLNTFEGCTARDVPEDLNSYWLDGWMPKGIQPDQFSSWDKVAKAWVDQRTLSEVKEYHWNLIKAERDRHIYADISTPLGVFDADPASQSKLLGAAQLTSMVQDYGVQWTLADNSVLNMTSADIILVVSAIASRTNMVYELARGLRNQINAWTSVEQATALTL